MDALLPSLHALSLSTVDTEAKRSRDDYEGTSVDPIEIIDSDDELSSLPGSESVDTESDDELPSLSVPKPGAKAVDNLVATHQKALGAAVILGASEAHPEWGRSMLCTYGTGTGKTRAALFAAAMWIRSGPVHDKSGRFKRFAFCVVRKSTMQQWVNEWTTLVQAFADDGETRFMPLNKSNLNFETTETSSIYRHGNLVLATDRALVSYGNAFGTKHRPRYNIMFIYDEAHSLRTLKNDDAESSGVMALLDFASKAGYVLLLTATPIMNSLSDLLILHGLLNKVKRHTLVAGQVFDPVLDPDDPVIDPFTLEEIETMLRDRFQGTVEQPLRRIVYRGPDTSRMPVVTEIEIQVELRKWDMQFARPINDDGVDLLKELNGGQLMRDPFMSKARGTTNKRKYEPLLNYITSSRSSRRFVVASGYLELGVGAGRSSEGLGKGFYEYIAREGRFREVRGVESFDYDTLNAGNNPTVLRGMSADFPSGTMVEVVHYTKIELGDLYKRWYEQEEQEEVIKVLLISPKASTGVSLRFTNEIHLLEPNFVPYEEDQVIGRGVRFDSHDTLPEAERKVLVVRWIGIVNPSLQVGAEHLMSADERVREINLNKRAMLEEPLKMLRDFGTENLAVLERQDWNWRTTMQPPPVPDGTAVQDVDAVGSY